MERDSAKKVGLAVKKEKPRKLFPRYYWGLPRTAGLESEK